MEYTVIGKVPRQPAILADSERFSVVLLGRGGRPFRADLLSELSRCEPAEILTMEGDRPVPEAENLADRFPRCRFYYVPGACPGALINLAAREVRSAHFLVLWSDTRLDPPVFSFRLLDSLTESAALCQVPWIVTEQGEPEPVRVIPAPGLKGSLETWFAVPGDRDCDTLYPYDYNGFYKREEFLALGGFDDSFVNPFWQKLDFGIRVRMTGGRILMNGNLRLIHGGQYPLTENTTRDADYPRFVLKNLLPRFKVDRLRLPLSGFLPWWRISGLSWRRAWELYGQMAQQFRSTPGRWHTDFPLIIESWDSLR